MNRKLRILLVDDDKASRLVLANSLATYGGLVEETDNGKRALELFKSQTYDLVVSDFLMPEMDGVGLTRQIRALGSTPVILVTGFSWLLETSEAYKLGATEFLPKPFEQSDLEVAIRSCFAAQSQMDSPAQYCKVAIADFVSGKQILFNIYLRLAEEKFVKIAHRGEDLSVDRIRAYREKGITDLYLRRDDFRTYVDFNLKLNKVAHGDPRMSHEKRLHLARHTGEIILHIAENHDMDGDLFESTASFVQTVVDALADDEQLLRILDSLHRQGDAHYAHAVGVCFYSLAVARMIGWTLPAIQFKVALGGLLHDIGENELDFLARPRKSWTPKEQKKFECHPLRGVEILSTISSIPKDVLQIVRHHHESCAGDGFPSHLDRRFIHPMAKLISVADVFCDYVLASPNNVAWITPENALMKMNMVHAEKLDKQCYEALTNVFLRR